MIKLLIVDDSSFMRKVITQMVTKDPEICVIDTAGDGREALEKIRDMKPDVVTMDVIMPLPDGLWALEEIMKQNPTPVVLVSSVASANSEIVEEAYSLGVVDVVQKPQKPEDMFRISQELITKIKAAAKVDKARLLAMMFSPEGERPRAKTLKQRAYTVVVIGSSAGGPIALEEVLPKIPADFSAGIIVSQHMPQQFLASYVLHLEKKCAFPIKIARDGDMVLQKRILFSPGDATLEIARTKKGAVVKISKPNVIIQPDIDMTIESCVEVFGNKTICVILSGMGAYGSEAARKVRAAGGIVISEDKSTASVWGMPEAIFSKGLADCILPSPQIANALINILAGKKPGDVKKEDFMVKGMVLKACIQYLKETFGPNSDQLVANACSKDLQDIIRNGLSVNLFYSSKQYLEFYQKTFDIFGSKTPKLFEAIGAMEAKMIGEYFKQSLFAKISSIESFVEILPKLLNLMFFGVSGEITEISSEKAQGSFILRNKIFDQEFCLRLTRERTIGWVKEILKTFLNISVVRITTSNGTDDKGPFIKINFNW